MLFKSTVWEEIDRARARDPEAYLQFVNKYRPAVVSFLRAQGYRSEDAEDLAQEAFLDIVRYDVLSKVDRSKGKFRNLILAVTTKIALKERRRRHALKRGGEQTTISLDETPVPIPEPSRDFDRIWVQQLVALAMRQLSAENPNYYRALALFLDGRSQKDIAREMGKSPAEANNYVHRAKAWVTRNVLRLISEYCTNDTEFQAEVDHLAEFIPHDGSI
jgi:RNA polymerase sigma factor (sigma-70 family)